jgi:hypothetical protein
VVLEQTSNDFGTFNRLDVLQLFWFLTDARGRTKDLIEFTTAGMFLLVTICTTFVWLTLVIWFDTGNLYDVTIERIGRKAFLPAFVPHLVWRVGLTIDAFYRLSVLVARYSLLFNKFMVDWNIYINRIV